MGASIGDSVVVHGVYGPCRYLRSPATDEIMDMAKNKTMSVDALTRWKEDRTFAAQRDGDIERGLTVAGMVAGYINDRPPVSELIDRMVEEAHACLARAATYVNDGSESGRTRT